MAKNNKKKKEPVYEGTTAEKLKDLENLRKKIKADSFKDPKRFYDVEDSNGDLHQADCAAGVMILRRQIERLVGKSSAKADYLKKAVEEATQQAKYIRETYTTQITRYSRKINQLLKESGDFSVLTHREGDLLDMLGKWFTVDEVHHVINNEWGYRVPQATIREWIRSKTVIIDQLKADYILRNKEFRIAHETGRMEVLNEQLAYWQRLFSERPSKDITKLIVTLLEQARKEVKGNDLHLTVDGKIDINATVQGAENIQEISKRLPINMMVIGLTAAKQGLNPLTMMAALASSYYATNNGFNGSISGNEEIKSPVSLIKSYDWGDLERKHKEVNQEVMQPISDIIEIEDKKEAKIAKGKRVGLLDSLKNIEKKHNL